VEASLTAFCNLQDIHKHISVAKAYERDAEFLLESARVNGHPLSTTSPWKSIYVESLQLRRSLNEKKAQNVNSLYMMAKFFIEDLCSVDPQSVNYSVSSVLETAIAFRLGLTEKEKIVSTLTEIANEEVAGKVWHMIDNYFCKKLLEASKTSSVAMPLDAEAETTSTSTANLIIVDQEKQKCIRPLGEDHLPGNLACQVIHLKDNITVI
jgi:hypothetical protein